MTFKEAKSILRKSKNRRNEAAIKELRARAVQEIEFPPPGEVPPEQVWGAVLDIIDSHFTRNGRATGSASESSGGVS